MPRSVTPTATGRPTGSSTTPSASQARLAWSRLLPRVLAALPSDVDGRALALDNLVAVIPPALPEARTVAEIRGFLDAHILAHRELALGDTRGSGRLGDQPMERGSR